MMPSKRFAVVQKLAVILAASLLGACCACPPKEKPVQVPPPLTLDEQVTLLNTRAAGLNHIAARGSVKMTWQEKDRTRTESADATVRIRQYSAEESPAKFGGDLVLFGRVAGQEVFQFGKNPQAVWFLVRLDTKTAWVGTPAELASAGADVGDGATLRADVLLDLLAVTPVPEMRFRGWMGAGTNQAALQRQLADGRHVEVMIFETGVSRVNSESSAAIPVERHMAHLRLLRVVTMDRVTQEPVKVTLYDREGVAVVTSTLSNYKDAPYREGERFRADRAPQRLPGRVEIEYAKPKASVVLTLEDIYLPNSLSDKVFQTPRFAEEGLKVEPIR